MMGGVEMWGEVRRLLRNHLDDLLMLLDDSRMGLNLLDGQSRARSRTDDSKDDCTLRLESS